MLRFKDVFLVISFEAHLLFLIITDKALDKVKTSMVAELFGLMCFEIKGKINPSCFLGLL